VIDEEAIPAVQARPPLPRAVPRWHIAISATLAIGAGAWAFRPLPAIHIESAESHASAVPDQKPVRPLNLAAFRAPLWVAPPPPAAPPVAPPPPPPMKLQLIAIVSDQAAGGQPGRAALVYDPDQDKLLTLHEGDSIQGRTIERISDADMCIRDGSGPRTLALRPDRSGGMP
jgi:hypothetical protein